MPGIQLLVELDDRGTPKLDRLEGGLNQLGRVTDKQGKKWKRNFNKMDKSVKQLHKRVRGFSSSMPALLGAAGIGAGMGMLLKKGISFNSELEAIETQFRVIVGDADKTRKIMADIVKFSARTPFQLTEVARAGKILQAFGLEGIENLEMVGDAAAAAGRPIEEIALQMGKIKSGAFGEAFMRLAETGLATRAMLEMEGLEFNKGGSFTGSADEAIQAVSSIVRKRYGGMMGQLANTWKGGWSTMLDNFNLFVGKLTKPLFTKLKPRILEITQLFNEWSADENLDKIADGLATNVDVMIEKVKALASTVKYLDEFQEKYGTLIGIVSGAALGARFGIWGAALGSAAAGLGIAEKKTGLLTKALGYYRIGVNYANQAIFALADGFMWMNGLMSKTAFALGSTFGTLGLIISDFVVAGIDSFTTFASTFGDIAKLLGQGIVEALNPFSDSMGEEYFSAIGETASKGIAEGFSHFDVTPRLKELAGHWGDVAGAWNAETFLESWRRRMEEADGFKNDILGQWATPEGGGRVLSAPVIERDFSAADRGQMPGIEPGFNEKLFEEYEAKVADHHETMASMWDGYYSGLESTIVTGFTDTLASTILDTSQSLADSLDQIWSSMKDSFVRSTIEMGVQYAVSKAKMLVIDSIFRKKAMADSIAGAAVTGATAKANQVSQAGAATAGAYAAYAPFPFIGPALAAGYVTNMLAAIPAAQGAAAAFRTGTSFVSGSGVEDDIPANLSRGEAVIPASSVRQYGGSFIEGVRTGTLQPQGGGGSLNLQFNLEGSGLDGFEEEVETEIVPILNRLLDQRRFST